MKSRAFWSRPIPRNLVGIVVLLAAWFLPDRFFFAQREGFQKFLPYFLLLSMYGWIVFHNRILIERLYLAGKRPKYLLWTGVIMAVASMNMYLTIRFIFPGADPLPQILGLWVFTIAGAGVYLLFRHRSKSTTTQQVVVEQFEYNADGRQHSMSLDSILYIESLENYIKLFTDSKTFIVRMSMKDAEGKLSPPFIRISRSHLVNPAFIEVHDEDSVTIGSRELKIGKVYKKYVKELIADLDGISR